MTTDFGHHCFRLPDKSPHFNYAIPRRDTEWNDDEGYPVWDIYWGNPKHALEELLDMHEVDSIDDLPEDARQWRLVRVTYEDLGSVEEVQHDAGL